MHTYRAFTGLNEWPSFQGLRFAPSLAFILRPFGSGYHFLEGYSFQLLVPITPNRSIYLLFRFCASI